MSLLNISNKSIIYDIFFSLPIERRLGIINCSKAYYNKLEYLPMIKKMFDKIIIYMNNQIDEKFKKNCDYKETLYKIISSDVLENIIANLKIKFNRELSNNFQELIKEMFIEILKFKGIYLSNDYSDFENYKKINKFYYHNNIINFSDSFYNILTNENMSLLFNNDKIFGIIIKITNININNLGILNKIFNNIHFLMLDFSDFFNNFNDLEIDQIFNYLDEFVKKNPIEIFDFIDNTERTLSFVENFQKFTENLNNLNKFYMTKYFKNRKSKKIIREAFENDNYEILSLLEDPNLILKNYLENINDKINILNLKISNPCSINGDPGNGSFISLATGSERFTIISKFQNLEEFVLLYCWPAEYYYRFDGSDSLANSLNSIKSLKKVIFLKDDYLLKALSSIKVENAYFIGEYYSSSEITKYYPRIIETEMLNNIKNIEIKINSLCEYKNKILKYDMSEDDVDNFFNFDCEKMPGLKNIEQLILIIRAFSFPKKCEYFTNLILNACNQNNHLKKIIFNYIFYDISKILEILYYYCGSNDTLKNIELAGEVELNNINKILDYILKIKEQKIDIVVYISNILENKIKEAILNNQNIINGKLSIENNCIQ